MASNKECLIIVLDVRTCAAEDVKLKSVKCASEIIKEKIVCDKKDLVSFVLVGRDISDNNLKAPNVVQYEKIQLCSWSLLLEFFKSVNTPVCEEGQWLDGLEVALKLQEEALKSKPARRRILLLFDFNSFPQNYEKFNTITDTLFNEDIELIVGTHNISYIDGAESGQPQAIFNFSRKSSPEELKNQKYALSLVSRCNATLCNFKEALRTVFKVTNRRPWSWNAKLHIGSKISINLQGVIAMKNQTSVKLKKVWGEDNEVVSRETRHFIKGTEVTPQPEELVTGYMLGGTPVPYDDTLLEPKEPHPPGLHFFGFIKRDAVPDEYYCGDSLYLLVHQKGNTASANKLDALVRALIASDRAILCWKIYSSKFNTPRMVVLLPRLADDSNPATLYMLEVSYTDQHHFWDFPALRTAKSESSEEQLQAIDRLIDSTDLECSLRDTQQPRPWPQNDLLPFDGLPSIFEQNVMDVLEWKVIDRSIEKEDNQSIKKKDDQSINKEDDQSINKEDDRSSKKKDDQSIQKEDDQLINKEDDQSTNKEDDQSIQKEDDQSIKKKDDQSKKDDQAKKDAEMFAQMVKDKKFADVFWRVPEPLEEKSKQAAATVKKLFPMRYSREWLEKLKAKEQAENGEAVKQEPPEKEIPMPSDGVGLSNPVQDFTRILASVRTITNATQKDARFQALAAQVRVLVFTLLERKKLNSKELGELISLYRQSCVDFNAFLEYDKFAEELKAAVRAKNLKEFWQMVVMDKQLGPLVLGEPTLDDELALKAYYGIDNRTEEMEVEQDVVETES